MTSASSPAEVNCPSASSDSSSNRKSQPAAADSLISCTNSFPSSVDAPTTAACKIFPAINPPAIGSLNHAPFCAATSKPAGQTPLTTSTPSLTQSASNVTQRSAPTPTTPPAPATVPAAAD